MIQANELRIGSTYELGESIITLGPKDLRDILELEEIENIHPIQITTEIIEKLGFNQSHQGYYELSTQLFNLTFDEHGLDIAFKDCDIANNLDHIKYVHQLQNLYFALTGEELQVAL